MVGLARWVPNDRFLDPSDLFLKHQVHQVFTLHDPEGLINFFQKISYEGKYGTHFKETFLVF